MPARIGSAGPTTLNAKSALVAEPAVVDHVAELSAGLVSSVVGVGYAGDVRDGRAGSAGGKNDGKSRYVSWRHAGDVQVIVPVPPAAGVEQVQPAGSGVSDANVALAGIASVNTTFGAALGPLLVTVWV